VKASEGDARPLEVLRAEALAQTEQSFRGRRHDVTTNRGVVAFLNEAINAFVIDPDGGLIEREELNTLGYVCGIQLKAIAAVQQEESPSDSLSDILGMGATVEIKMTREERKAYLTAGSVDKMARVLEQVKKDGRILELEPQPDGSYGIPPKDEPPRTDAPMPITEIRQAMAAEGIDIKRDELTKLVGERLGHTPEVEVELFGFDEFMAIQPKDEEALRHLWQSITVQNPDMPGVAVRRHRCTKCGVTTNNTNKHDNEPCEIFGTEDVFRQ
jgi:hypothetical protein